MADNQEYVVNSGGYQGPLTNMNQVDAYLQKQYEDQLRSQGWDPSTGRDSNGGYHTGRWNDPGADENGVSTSGVNGITLPGYSGKWNYQPSAYTTEFVHALDNGQMDRNPNNPDQYMSLRVGRDGKLNPGYQTPKGSGDFWSFLGDTVKELAPIVSWIASPFLLGAGIEGLAGAGLGDAAAGAGWVSAEGGAGYAGGLAADAGALGGAAGSFTGGQSAADMFNTAYPAGGTSAGGASGELGSGMYGAGNMDIGALMGTVGDGGASLGSGLYGLGDLGSLSNANLMGDYGMYSDVPNQAGGHGGNDWINTGDNKSWLQNQAEKQGQKYLQNQVQKALMPQPQGRPQSGNPQSMNMPAPIPMAPVDTNLGRGTGALSLMDPFNRQAPVGYSSPIDPTSFRLSQQMNRPSNGASPVQDFSTLNNLPNGNNDATLAGYELWKALNPQSH